MSRTLIGLGVMSGSSLDGIDAILVNINEDSFSIIQKESIALPAILIERLRHSSSLPIKEYLLLESEYTAFLGNEIKKRFRLPYDFIAIHGHTTHHLPERMVSNQMINGGVLSSITKKKVVADFRSGDIALGGTGTPMIPIVERNLFDGYHYYLNLGGIANMTIAKGWIAYDVCPCNQLLNNVAKQLGKEYDENGNLAKAGNLNKELLLKLGAFPFYEKEPPKAIDNNWISDHYFPLIGTHENPIDVLHTITVWIAKVIADQMKKKGKLFITGGGAHNAFLINCIKMEVEHKEIELVIPDKEVVDFKEAILMAYLGYLRINLKSTMLCSVTGAKMDSIGGAIYNVHGK